jgi:tetratricopeptide (TPR) repeat protein
MLQKMKPKKGNSPIIFINPDAEDEQNPEWKKFMESSELQEKLQEISELQMEGADVMHSSFINLKQYPFFNEPSNWFVPFSLESDAIENPELSQLAEMLQASTTLCNSDKYSFFWSILNMPDDHRKQMINQFSAENDATKEMREEELPAKKIDFRTRQYIQDLYRFYKLHPRRRDFEDIFETQPEFYQVPSINQILRDHKQLQLIGEYYFSKEYWAEANDIFEQLLHIGFTEDLAVLYQKKGYALQMLEQAQPALETYLLADVYDTDNPWTIKKIAHLYRQLKQPQEALNYYLKVEQLQPDNLSIQLTIGHCYLDLQEYELALKQYFKVEYLSDNKLKVRRASAWTSFLLEKYEQASEFYNKIMAEAPNTLEDYLNAGHVQLVSGNKKGAINLYYFALIAEKRSHKEFVDLFYNDLPHLLERGVKEEEIPLILDSVLYQD